jgi:hypothetical protein
MIPNVVILKYKNVGNLAAPRKTAIGKKRLKLGRPMALDSIYRYAITQLPVEKFKKRIDDILSDRITLLR